MLLWVGSRNPSSSRQVSVALGPRLGAATPVPVHQGSLHLPDEPVDELDEGADQDVNHDEDPADATWASALAPTEMQQIIEAASSGVSDVQDKTESEWTSRRHRIQENWKLVYWKSWRLLLPTYLASNHLLAGAALHVAENPQPGVRHAKDLVVL